MPLFLFLAGISLVISDHHAKMKGALHLQTKKIIVRAIFIFAAGILFRVLNYGPQNVFAFGILSCIGFTTLLYLLLRKMSFSILLAFIIIVFFASPYLRMLVPETLAIWKVGFVPVTVHGPWNVIAAHFLHTTISYHDIPFQNSISQLFFSLFFSGEFPLFPWMIYPVIGTLLGRKIVEDQEKEIIKPLAMASFALCAAGIVAACFSLSRQPATDFITPFSFFSTSPSLLT